MEKSYLRQEFVNSVNKKDFHVSETGINFETEHKYLQRGGLVLVCIGVVQSVGLERKRAA